MVKYELNHVYKTFKGIVKVLEDSFPSGALVEFTELLRGKPLRTEQDVMPVAMTGYCIALLDVDLVCTRIGLDPVLTQAAWLHEMAHLLLGHISSVANGASTPDYHTFLSRRDTHPSLKRLPIYQYNAQHELEAETLATLLMECIAKDQRSAPYSARDLGW